MLRRVWPALGALLLAACTPASPKPAPSPGTAAPPASVTAGGGPSKGVGVRECGDSTYINVGHNPDPALIAGPVRFAPLDYTLGSEAFRYNTGDAQGWRWFKTVVTISNGTTAVVSLPAAYRDVAVLAYINNGRDHTTTFIACDPAPGGISESQFPGGFVIQGAICLPVDVSWGGRTQRLTLNFGKDAC